MTIPSSPTAARERIIVFDLGGILVHCVNGWLEACARADVPPGSPADDPASYDELQECCMAYERGQVDSPSFFGQVGRLVGLAPSQVEAVMSAWLVGLKPGAAELIEDLCARGLPTAVLSNTNAWHWAELRSPTGRFAPLRRLHHHFASHELNTRKPESEIYAIVEQRLERRGQEIVFFDDLPENVEAARGRGWQAHCIFARDPVLRIRTVLVDEALLDG